MQVSENVYSDIFYPALTQSSIFSLSDLLALIGVTGEGSYLVFLRDDFSDETKIND